MMSAALRPVTILEVAPACSQVLARPRISDTNCAANADAAGPANAAASAAMTMVRLVLMVDSWSIGKSLRIPSSIPVGPRQPIRIWLRTCFRASETVDTVATRILTASPFRPKNSSAFSRVNVTGGLVSPANTHNSGEVLSRVVHVVDGAHSAASGRLSEPFASDLSEYYSCGDSWGSWVDSGPEKKPRGGMPEAKLRGTRSQGR